MSKWWERISRHPFWGGVVAKVVGGLILALILFLISMVARDAESVGLTLVRVVQGFRSVIFWEFTIPLYYFLLPFLFLIAALLMSVLRRGEVSGGNSDSQHKEAIENLNKRLKECEDDKILSRKSVKHVLGHIAWVDGQSVTTTHARLQDGSHLKPYDFKRVLHYMHGEGWLEVQGTLGNVDAQYGLTKSGRRKRDNFDTDTSPPGPIRNVTVTIEPSEQSAKSPRQ